MRGQGFHESINGPKSLGISDSNNEQKSLLNINQNNLH